MLIISRYVTRTVLASVFQKNSPPFQSKHFYMDKKKIDRSRERIFKLSKFQKDKVVKLKDAKIHTWNPLFLGSNATADALSAKMGVEKYDLLAGNGESSSAVRMAMAETKLVKETRDFLLSSNVKLDKPKVLESGEKERRSDTTIIVKNLPSGIGPEELRSAFARFGGVKDVKISPGSGLCAIIEMESRVDAKRVFNRLAYSTLPGRDQPLYLEWAPLQVDRATTFRIEAKPREQREEQATEPWKQTKILVKNVPFQATVDELTQLFSAFGEIKATRLPKKTKLFLIETTSICLSSQLCFYVGACASSPHRGFCFVDYVVAGDAKRAYDALYLSTHLYGRRLVLEWAKVEETVEEMRSKSAKKLRYSKKECKGNKKSIQTAIKRKHSSEGSDDD